MGLTHVMSASEIHRVMFLICGCKGRYIF